MEERYDVYFAGQMLAGHDPEQVRRQLATLFNADQKTLDLLFSGTPRLIKRGCDRATAQKYKNAMEQAGAAPIIARSGAQPGNTGTAAKPWTTAEKIAALAAQPDDVRYLGGTATATTDEQPPADALATASIGLAPPGTAVLREEERAAPQTREIDTSWLEVDTTATRLSEVPDPPDATPDTGHLSLAEAGATIPNLPSSATPLSPDTDGLVLSEPGADFSDCAAPEAPPPALDLSRLSTEPPGADILEERYRKPQSSAAPATDHLSLED
jgi:hypothetical protein